MRGGGIVSESLAISPELSIEPNGSAAQSLSQPDGCQPSAQVAIIDCSRLWLKTCHRHVFFTRRPLYTREPFLLSEDQPSPWGEGGTAKP